MCLRSAVGHLQVPTRRTTCGRGRTGPATDAVLAPALHHRQGNDAARSRVGPTRIEETALRIAADRPALVRLLGRLRPLAWLAAGAFTATIAATAVALVAPLALRSIVDGAITPGSGALEWLPGELTGRALLVGGAGALIVLGVLRAGLSFLQRYGTAWVGRTVATDLRRDVFARLVSLDLAYHDRARVGQLMTRVTDDTEQVRQFTATAAAELVNIAVLLIGAAVILLRIDPLLAAIALSAVPVLAVMAVWAAKELGPRFLLVQRATGGLTARLQESLAQIRVVQAFTAEGRTATAYEADNEVLYARRTGVARVFTTIFPAMSLVLAVATAAVLGVGGQRVIAGELTIGTLVAFESYILLLGMPVRRLGFLLNLAARASASATRVYELLDRQPALADPVAPRRLDRAEGWLAWEHVDFAYDTGAETGAGSESGSGSGSEATLRDVTLTVEPGEHVAIVGRSGAGKTTLVQLLPRLYDPTRGVVRIDGVDVRELTRADLRAAVAYVEQEAFLFSASVHDNVAFGAPDATREQVETATRLAGAHDFVSDLPEGYDTVVGERGVTLSGGQRQRVALARALVTAPAILVLDDAVSALDAGTEGRIRAALRAEAGRTTIVSVAQRLSTILAADRIVVLEGGRVVEKGTHGELLAAGGAYARLFARTLATRTGPGDDADPRDLAAVAG